MTYCIQRDASNESGLNAGFFVLQRVNVTHQSHIQALHAGFEKVRFALIELPITSGYTLICNGIARFNVALPISNPIQITLAPERIETVMNE
ncbi:MAG: hypothetical protein Q7T62_11025 [Undibacterium sp.]|nr:hypothetical protein [Undibacterium sp.]